MAALTLLLRCSGRAGLAALALVAGTAAMAVPTDISVEAAFLPRFARYVTWPASAMPKGASPFVLCVIGSDPFGALLDQAAESQTIAGRRIVVRRLNSAASAGDCQIAFISANRLSELGDMAGRPVLTVTDASNGQQQAIIRFAVLGGRVRFFIDQAAAQRRSLSISSRLLALAVGVRQ